KLSQKHLALLKLNLWRSLLKKISMHRLNQSSVLKKLKYSNLFNVRAMILVKNVVNTLARGFKPCSFTAFSDANNTTAAPSTIPDEFPA
ncbi:hypothetical protein, partial [Vogesella mureinivorans]|uniref:hypothetical protein n=1 Tax=Vogesella mureinivorans TaxID=657276 RepID=UPI00197E307F